MRAAWATLAAACVLVGLAAARAPAEPGRALRQLDHHEDADARGWGNFNREGYAVAANAPGLVCPAGQVDCHYRGVCVDLQTNALYCGDCSIVCDFNVEQCVGGQCTCMPDAPPCPYRGGKCLHKASCDALAAGGV